MKGTSMQVPSYDGFRVRLNQAGYESVRESRYGKDFREFVLGKARVHLDNGLAYANVPWGLDGLDVPLSSDISPEYIDEFELKPEFIKPHLNEGDYLLRNKSGHILARGRVTNHPGGSSVLVMGKVREHVINLCTQICAGETAPEAAGGRKGLIRGLHGVVESLTQMAEDLARQVGVLEGREEVMSEYRANLEKQVQDLRAENVELNNPKISAWKFFWRAFFGTNDPSVA